PPPFDRSIVPLDHPHPVYVCRSNGLVYLPLVWKTFDGRRDLSSKPAKREEDRVDVTNDFQEKGEWVWSYSTTQAHLFLSLVADISRYYSQLLEFDITSQSLYIARKCWGIYTLQYENSFFFACFKKQ